MKKITTKLENIKIFIFFLWREFALILSEKHKSDSKLGNLLTFLVVFIFFIIYIPHTFILNEDFNLASAFEVDPGSIISSINDLFNFPIYNMMNGYHTKYYGWTHASISFICLIPVKIISYITDYKNPFATIFTIRLVFFSIGLAMVLFFNRILCNLSGGKHYFLNFLLTILLLSSSMHHIFYFIHPESTGALFVFLSILCLLEYLNSERQMTFFLGVISMSLASLSKQPFFIACLPILFCFIYWMKKKSSLSWLSFLKTDFFAKTTKQIFILSLFTFVLVHPYAFIKLKDFLTFQYQLGINFYSKDVSYFQSICNWLVCIKYNFLMFLSLLSLAFVIPYSFYKHIKTNEKHYFLAGMNGASAIICFLFVAYGNRTVVYDNYLLPSYLFLFLNIFCLGYYILIFFRGRHRFVFSILASIFLLFSIYKFGKETIHDSIIRLNYKESIAFKSYNYIKGIIKPGDKIAHDQLVAIPQEFKSASCHFWAGCGTDFIEEFNPNYVIFDPNFSYIKPGPTKETQRLNKYVQDHKMILIGKISSDMPVSLSVSIYKKK
ncbi:hypothetical protein [Candidatus Methylopumilus universalis]|uniref:hypothetical protein n=1 Tax=Candidatus Methylopumilus universalis TaxID=2588536 RepID=UPI001122837B|nr:hypothetical protein [Candidatus Methylopumilus universalis]QDC88110.1 hypothetical protein FIT81_04210 [Candidatus Methylopumilus universalis]